VHYNKGHKNKPKTKPKQYGTVYIDGRYDIVPRVRIRDTQDEDFATDEFIYGTHCAVLRTRAKRYCRRVRYTRPETNCTHYTRI